MVLVKHAWAFAAYEKEENQAIEGPDSCAFMKAMSVYVTAYDKIAKEKPIADGESEYLGHPQGTRPEACFRHLIQ